MQEALEGLMMKEELHGYISAKTKQQVSPRPQMILDDS